MISSSALSILIKVSVGLAMIFVNLILVEKYSEKVTHNHFLPLLPVKLV